VGIRIEHEAQKRSLQQGCRPIVTRILGGDPEYWGARFSADRIAETRQSVDSLLLEYKLAHDARDAVSALIEEDASTEEHERSEWLLAMLTEPLVATPVDAMGLDSALAQVVRSLWSGGADLERLEEACLASDSPWDRYLRSLTPDLPMVLSDHARLIATRGRFRNFWRDINRRLTPDQKAKLRDWYSAQARDVAQMTVAFPDEA
jgi:hypothetical protein